MISVSNSQHRENRPPICAAAAHAPAQQQALRTPALGFISNPRVRAIAQAYLAAKAGNLHARFACTDPGCSGEIEFTASPKNPGRTAGSCHRPQCRIRWALQ